MYCAVSHTDVPTVHYHLLRPIHLSEFYQVIARYRRDLRKGKAEDGGNYEDNKNSEKGIVKDLPWPGSDTSEAAVKKRNGDLDHTKHRIVDNL